MLPTKALVGEVSQGFPGEHPAWNRQPGESFRAYKAFEILLAREPSKRSFRMVAHELHHAEKTISKWASEYGWADRLAAFDAEVGRMRDLELFEAAAKIRSERLHGSLKAAQAASRGLDPYLGDDAPELTPVGIKRLAEASAILSPPTEQIQPGTFEERILTVRQRHYDPRTVTD